jgi:proline iminopeptidase
MTPDEFTNREFFLDVGDGHQLYIHDWGNEKAKLPIVYLHGGPGAACNDSQKTLYDPTTQRVIFFDQRGSGRSIPIAALDHNTTDDLVADITKVVDAAQVQSFVLHGRSWGSCLALYYAIKHPQRVAAIITGGMFLGTKRELNFDEKGDRYKTFFPERWQEFLADTPATHQAAPMSYHMRQILNGDTTAAKKSAYAYSRLILGVIKLDDRRRQLDFETLDPSSLIVEAHYKLNNCFMPDNFIMEHATKLTMPIWIIQGRYDVMCVPSVAYELHRALPQSHLSWVTAGHSGSDRAVYDASRPVLELLTKEV